MLLVSLMISQLIKLRTILKMIMTRQHLVLVPLMEKIMTGQHLVMAQIMRNMMNASKHSVLVQIKVHYQEKIRNSVLFK